MRARTHGREPDSARRLSPRPSVPQSARRICSGGCDYFTPVYQSGRKIAGVGMCENARCGADVRVGMICLWAKKSLSSETFLAGYGNVLGVRPQIAS